MKIFLVLLLCLLVISCDEEKGIANHTAKNQIVYLATLQESADVFLITDRLKIKSLDGQNYDYKYQNSTYFFDENGQNVIVGKVSLNESEILQKIDSSNVGFNNSNLHIWKVEDSRAYFNFYDTINQKLNFNLTFPNSISDTVSKSNGFYVDFSVANDCDSVLIMLNTENFISHYKVDSTINKTSQDQTFYKIVQNNGSTFFSSNELANFNSSRILSVDVVGLVYENKIINGKKVITASVMRCKSFCLLGV